MTKAEILTFIEEMENHNDYWTEDEVKDTYGDKSLEEALSDRLACIALYNKGLFLASMGTSMDEPD